jgi:superfamily II DNA or RNA helicase
VREGLRSNALHLKFRDVLAVNALKKCDSWRVFNDRVSQLPAGDETEKGNAFELLVKLTLQLHPLYATKLEKVWHHHEVPSHVREHLRLPPKDKGIDLVARTFDGDYWTIQAKYRADPSASPTFTDLSKFAALSFVVCRGVSFGLVCTTTRRITSVLEGIPRIGLLTSDFWQGLPAELFAEIKQTLCGKTPSLVPTNPYPHQTRAVTKSDAHFITDAKTRGKFISPCGSGKSLTAYWMARSLGAKRVVIAVPSLFLIGQTLRTWLRESLADRRQVNWLCVCSDESAGEIEDDDLVTQVHDLGIPCETDPALVAEKMRQMTAPVQIVLTTYHSSPAFASAAHLAGWACDLAVLDEAHKTTGHRDSSFSHLLFDRNLEIPRRIFMTATERRYVGKSDEVASMDDPDLYGETFESLTFKAAIEATPPILSDYKVHTISVTDEEVKRLIRERSFVSLDPDKLSERTATLFASLVAIRRAVETCGVRHAVSFHSSIARAQEFQRLSREFNRAFPELPEVASFHVSGKMASGERSDVLRDFVASEPSLVTNARCLTEGVDVPKIDCVLFADPKGSKIDVVQAAGRALRLADGKLCGHIIIPFVVPEGAALEAAAESAGFAFVVFVLRALASNDERIVEELRAISRGQPPKTGRILNFDVSAIFPVAMDAEHFIKAIELKCWGRLAQLAPRSYVDASAFVQGIGVRSQKQFRKWRRGGMPNLPPVPEDLPASPDRTYHGTGWTTWGDFFGTKNESVHKIVHLPYEEARAIVRLVGIKSPNEWFLYSVGKLPGKPRRPKNVPSRPHESYGEAWVSWADFLGYSPRLYGQWLPFPEARAFARSLKLHGQKAWKHYCSGRMPHLPPRPKKVPTAPDSVYADEGWVSYSNWVGLANERKVRNVTRDFESARAFARSLGLRSSSEWDKYHAKKIPGLPECPNDIPSKPRKVYADKGWAGWDDWLGRA